MPASTLRSFPFVFTKQNARPGTPDVLRRSSARYSTLPLAQPLQSVPLAIREQLSRRQADLLSKGREARSASVDGGIARRRVGRMALGRSAARRCFSELPQPIDCLGRCRSNARVYAPSAFISWRSNARASAPSRSTDTFLSRSRTAHNFSNSLVPWLFCAIGCVLLVGVIFLF